MNEAIRQLPSDARQLTRGKVPTAIRYPAPFRAAAAALTRTQLDQGASVHRVAGALGVPARSLSRWTSKVPRRCCAPSRSGRTRRCGPAETLT